MKTSLYIQNSKIELLSAAPARDGLDVADWQEYDLPAEAVVGGVVINDSAVVSTLAKIKAEQGRDMSAVNLIVDSNRVFAKTLTVPFLPESKLLKLIESEFSDLENRGELLYDYMTLRGRSADGNGGVVLATAAEKDFIGSYMRLMKDADIRVESIDIALACLARLADTEAVRGKTCIVAELNSGNITLALFLDGVFRMFTHSRLFQERGTLASVSEIAQLISSLLQFHAAEKTGREVTNVYFGGLEKNELRTTADASGAALASVSLCERLNAALDIRASEFPACPQISVDARGGKRRPFAVSNYLCSVGNLLGR